MQTDSLMRRRRMGCWRGGGKEEDSVSSGSSEARLLGPRGERKEGEREAAETWRTKETKKNQGRW